MIHIFVGCENNLLILLWQMSYLVPFVQFKKCKKHPWRSGTFSKVAYNNNDELLFPLYI